MIFAIAAHASVPNEKFEFGTSRTADASLREQTDRCLKPGPPYDRAVPIVPRAIFAIGTL